MSRRRKESDQQRLVKNTEDDKGDVYDDKRQYKYDFRKAAEDYTIKHMKENEIDEEFAEATVVNNPVFSPEGAVFNNPTYMVSSITLFNCFYNIYCRILINSTLSSLSCCCYC